MTGMDHAYVEEHGLVEAYLGGRLSERERDAFEAHYFDCETCLEHLETANDFREGMHQVAAEDIAQVSAARAWVGLLAGLAALSRWHRLALAAFVLLIAALPSLWLIERNRGLQQQLAAASTGAERERAALEARQRGLEQAGTGDRRQLTEALERERQAREAAAQPQVNVPLFVLAAVRSGEQEGREPVNQVPLSPTTGSVILTAELATVDFPSYRASLHGAGGKEIWQARGLRPDSRDTLVVLLPASMLQPGVYRLTIEGAQSGGKWFPVGDYPFRVVRRP
ncbi:MAG TPA: zf-HC2 domain-containing protein [Thermoanaerobaculia bacterium]|nr:zf-HC2 domain-containing protein [Thermoanaerobaculia bacterium]